MVTTLLQAEESFRSESLVSILKFLRLFTQEKLTVQYLKQGKPAGFNVFQQVDKFAFSEMQKANSEGRDVYFMVNEGDGEIKAGNKIPRSQENVIKLTACFIDTDSCPFKTIKAYLKKVKVTPHFIIETSPKKYHIYFLLKHIPPTKQNLRKWKAIQECLAYLGNPKKLPTGCDTSMTDHGRVLRVPGLYHLKNPKNPFRVRLVIENYFQEPFDLNELYDTLEAKRFDTLHKDTVRDDSNVTKGYQISINEIGEGQRHAEMTKFLGHLIETGTAPEMAKLAFERYAETTFKNGRVFLPGGERHHEVETFLAWKAKETEKEQRDATLADVKLLTEQNSPTLSDPFALPQDFYENCPGLVGEITKDICATARYPAPSFAFAAAISAIGTLKAPYQISDQGHAPSNYFLCLAHTGAGKNYPQEVLSYTFNKLGVSALIQTGVRSEKGIARFLENNNSIGMLCLDEAELFFSFLDDIRTPHYLKMCKSFLLEIYTATNMPKKALGQVGDKKEKQIVLSHPRLNILAHGVVNALDRAFTLRSVQDGLLQRFIILTHYQDRKKNPEFKPAKALNGDLFSYLESLVTKGKHAIEQELFTQEQLETEFKSAKTPELKGELEEKLNRLKSKRTNRKALPFSQEAENLFNKFSQNCDDKINEEVKKLSGLEGIYTRAAEQVGRLAVVIEESDKIQAETIRWCAKFIISRIKALHGYCQDKYQRGDLSKEVEKLVQMIASNTKADDPVVTWRTIVRYAHIQEPRRLKELLETAIEMRLIKKVENYRKPGSRPGKKGVGFMLDEVFD